MPRTKDFDSFLSQRRKEPEFEAAYRAELKAIRNVDKLVRELEGERKKQSITKQELSEQTGINASQIRRTLTASGGNPTLKTFLLLVHSLGLEVSLRPSSTRARVRH